VDQAVRPFGHTSSGPCIGLGIAFTGIGAVTLFGSAVAVAVASARKARKITIPETAASLTEPGLNIQ
jgi:hypothetical protein